MELQGSVVLSPTCRFLAILAFTLFALTLLVGTAAGDDLPWKDDFDDGDMDGWKTNTSRSGIVQVDRTQSKSSPFALHIR